MITNTVKTVFSAVSAPFTGPVSKIASAAQGAGSMIGGITSLLSPLTLALSAIGGAGAISQITSLGSAFENANLQIGGMLTAIGRTGNMEEGLRASAQVMEGIRVSAAALPGEADDYITVFQAGLVSIEGAMGGTLRQSMAFSNSLTAVGRMWGIDAHQIGSDMQRLLQAGQGGAGMDVTTFTKMLPYLRTLEGQANLNAQAFNRMTAPERLALLQRGLGTLDPMLAAAGNTWDAVSGTFMSNIKEIGRLVSAPIFDKMKEALNTINGLLYDNTGTIQPFAQQIIRIGTVLGGWAIDGFGKAFTYAKQLFGMVVQVGTAIAGSPGFSFLVEAFQNMGALVGNIQTAVQGVFAGAEGGMGGVISALMASFNSLSAIVLTASQFMSTVIAYLAVPFAMITDLVVGFLPEALAGAQDLFAGMAQFGAALVSIYTTIWGAVRPAFQSIASALGSLYHTIFSTVGVAFRVLAAVMMVLWSKVKDYVLPVLTNMAMGVANAFQTLMRPLAQFRNWLLRMVGSRPTSTGSGASFLDQVRAAFQASGEGGGADEESVLDTARDASAAATPRAPGGRPGGHTVQDFRNSRFTIEQKFEEGFDPDRIAVAFAQDLGRVAEERLQSGFEPMFSVR